MNKPSDQLFLEGEMRRNAFLTLKTPIIDPQMRFIPIPETLNSKVPVVDPPVDSPYWGSVGKKMDTYGQLILLLAILIPFVPPF